MATTSQSSIPRSVYWAAIASIFAIWVIAWGYAVYLGITQSRFNTFLLAFGGGLCVVCGVMFVGHATNLQELPKPLDKLIWLGLFAGILAASVDTYRVLITESRAIKLEKFMMLDEDQLEYDPALKQFAFKTVSARQTNTYKDTRKFAWIAVVSSFGTDDTDKMRIEVDVLFEELEKNNGNVISYPTLVDPSWWKNRKGLDAPVIESLVGNLRGNTVLVGWITEMEAPFLKAGSKRLRLTVKDGITKSAAVAEQRIEVRQSL
jgi:hypothetical protein